MNRTTPKFSSRNVSTFWLLLPICFWFASLAVAGLSPARLRCEYLEQPLAIDTAQPRLNWVVESAERGQRQTACRILVASSAALLEKHRGDLWDSGKMETDQTVHVVYAGKPLRSGQDCYWKVQVWDKDGQPSAWSPVARWAMGLLQPSDWQAQWISFRDTSPLHTDRNSLYLPPARHYRKEFSVRKKIRRAMLYSSALGLAHWELNGQAVTDGYFEPGWADYHQRAYYRAYDVTPLLAKGPNCLGAIVADGWYAGYVGYGLLVGYGPNKVGRYFYGKTPAVLGQLVVEFTDGSRQVLGTDATWQVSADGPFREADLIMGEACDARREQPGWSRPEGARAWHWEPAIPAGANGSTRAVFSDNHGNREVELGFQQPPVLQAYSAPPIRVTQELAACAVSEPKPGVYIYDLGQNFAGIIRLKLKGPAGTTVTIRYGEMLYRDGRLMTENLRRARATDFYTLRGDPQGETWSPRFTYHGFQYVELSGLKEKPEPGAITGLVLHNDTPLTGVFECSDPVLTRFGRNAQWTQRANFVEVPTDCPQRDERLGWMGDAQAYIRTATFNADVAAFFTKWLDDVQEAQRSFGAYPDYCPYPMGHGQPHHSAGTAWTDAGIICPWTVWRVYGDTRLLERQWASMTRFMDWRASIMSPDGLGVSVGNPWGDWLNVNEATPVEFIDTCYHALDCKLMADMADALGRTVEAANYRKRFAHVQAAFRKAYAREDGSLNVESQSAYVLALWVGLLPESVTGHSASLLSQRIHRAGDRMTTGFLGTRALLPALSQHGQHDLAVRLFQSRQFPSWGYEVVNGATTVWERWDSFTHEHGFDGQGGQQNASMNSFSHYAFGAVMEWAYRDLAGIDTSGPGYKRLLIKPGPPAPDSNPDNPPITWARAEYDSIRGKIISHWKRDGEAFELNLTVPANTTATV
ncbi:MAG TPA: family 78 glycoside hydrolase catalytic domain, partial [Clostridia bacterium]|nr:family 78 glycoside hydrolase catalytic domain [Clostridia bacterium]